MRKLYDANSTEIMINKILPSSFKIASDPTSNGYKFLNALYGIELDSIKDYLDQAKHFSSFENFDYGYDFDVQYVKLPEIISSGFIYGDDIPIKITTTNEFYDGKITRFVYDSGYILDLTNYNTAASGILGIEYMRQSNTGSGILYINYDLDSVTAIQSGTYQTQKLPLDDLTKPVYSLISGFNYGISDQNYDTISRYELLQPETEPVLKKKYPEKKTITLPKDGDPTKPNRDYIVDYYEPELYFWDNVNKIYKPTIPERDQYYDGTVKKYHRVYLNNPYGSGIYNTEYLELEHVPISGTLKVYDIDTLSNGLPTEINKTGTNVYRYFAYNSGNLTDPYFEYIGYTEKIPLEFQLGYDATATLYKITSWDYVHEDDGLVSFDWVTNVNKPLTNKIKLVNAFGRYIVEYKYVNDMYHGSITSNYSNRYVKYYNENHIYNSLDSQNNAQIIPNTLSIESETRRAITFDGLDVRPGTVINEIILRGKITNEYEISNDFSENVGPVIPGANKHIIPYNTDKNQYLVNYTNYTQSQLTPASGTIQKTFVNNILSNRITTSNLYLNFNNYYYLYNEELSTNRIIRFRFKHNTFNPNNIILAIANGDDDGWKIELTNRGQIKITDIFSTVISEAINDIYSGYIIDIIVSANGVTSYNYNNSRYSVYISINNSLFRKLELFENSEISFISNESNTIKFFNDTNVDIEFIKFYNEGYLNDYILQ